MHAPFLYVEPISNIIKKMKYQGAFALVAPLVELMASRPVLWQNPVDLLIPVPLHPKRQRERGYNQSALLARELSRHWQLSVEERALQRIRYTIPQVELSPAQRRVNVVGAFQADPQKIQHKHILLIDDVYTTGATLAAAAMALNIAGASSIAGYCAARTH